MRAGEADVFTDARFESHPRIQPAVIEVADGDRAGYAGQKVRV